MIFPRQSTSTPADTVDHILRIIEQADHDTLLRSGNEVYKDALLAHNGTKAELESLKYVPVTFFPYQNQNFTDNI